MSSDGERPVRFDLSPAITPGLGVWPGDNAPSREILSEVVDGASVTLSTLRTTVHLGTHADAPAHTSVDGVTIDQVDPGRYIGPCQVMHLDVDAGTLIEPDDLPDPVRRSRLLLATGTFADPQSFTTDWAVPSPTLIDHLATRGVGLLGTDAPSMDLFAATTMETHTALARHGIAILEGLLLEQVPAGDYELIAPPLSLVGFDASPVRAVLRDLPDS